MNISRTARAFAIVAIAAAALSACGDRKKAEFDAKAAQNVAAATDQLRTGLAVPAESADAVRQIQSHVDAAAALLAAVRNPDAKRSSPIADTAELYLVDVHAILHMRGRVTTLRNAARTSTQALVGHMRASSGRRADWIRAATTLQRRAEYDNVDYRRALASYTDLLQKHKDTQAMVRTVLPKAPLIEDAYLQQALQGAQDAERRALTDLDILRKSASPR